MQVTPPLFAALGGTLGFMLWVYLCAVILLLGAELGYVSSRYALSHEVLVDQPKRDDRRRQRNRESKHKASRAVLVVLHASCRMHGTCPKL